MIVENRGNGVYRVSLTNGVSCLVLEHEGEIVIRAITARIRQTLDSSMVAITDSVTWSRSK